MWSSESSAALIGCGVDAELVARFDSHDRPDHEPWDALFSPREIAHNRGLATPRLGFCASFCAKEAVIKAVGVPIDYRACELLFSPTEEEQDLLLSPELQAEHGVGRAVARVLLGEGLEECVVTVCLFAATAGADAEEDS